MKSACNHVSSLESVSELGIFYGGPGSLALILLLLSDRVHVEFLKKCGPLTLL